VRLVHSASITFAYWSLTEGAELPEHSHPHEQVAHVLEGEFELVIAGEMQRLRPGMVAIIPSNATHSGSAVLNCSLLDVFHPVREDYVAKLRFNTSS
jgi:quercetin dioxygenase-like cupin family protein